MTKHKSGKYARHSRFNIPLLLLCLLFLGIAVFSGYKVITIMLEYKEGEQVYEDLQQHIQLPAPTLAPQEDTTPTAPGYSRPPSELPEDPDALTPETEPYISPVDFEALWQINPDVVGWIYIPDTCINYPILQGETNDTYLYHLVTGKYNRSGSIFMDYRNLPDFSNQNTVIYGHHMGDGTMFADIVKFKRQSYFDAHPTGYLFTPEKTYTLTFFAAYVTDMRDDAWRREFAMEEDYADWLRDSAARSEVSCGILPVLTDQILTLSTCTYEYDDARFILAAIMD